MKNYRPISLISAVAKIFEKIAKKGTINFVKKHKLISENQLGFKKGVSTEVR